jgi:hypothetical protein
VVYVSAATGEGIDRLEEAVARRLDEQSFLVDAYVPLADGRLNAYVGRLGRPLEDEISMEKEERRIRLRLTSPALGNLRRTGGGSLRIELVAPPSRPGLVNPSVGTSTIDGDLGAGPLAAGA